MTGLLCYLAIGAIITALAWWRIPDMTAALNSAPTRAVYVVLTWPIIALAVIADWFIDLWSRRQ